MLDLGSTDFVLEVPSLPADELRRLSSALFDAWEGYIERSLRLPDYSLFLEVEEGSIKGSGKTAVMLYALYMGIGQYGDFVSGVTALNGQLAATRTFLAEHAGQMFSCPDPAKRARKRGGTLSTIQQLFVKVQRGDLTPDQAAEAAETLLGEEAQSEPRFLTDLKRSLRACPRHHTQVPLPFDDLPGIIPPDASKPRPQRRPSFPLPPIPPSHQYRIEIWRESKGKRKHSRVIHL